MGEVTQGTWYKESGDDDTFGYDIYYIHASGGKMVCEGICNPYDACLIENAKELLEISERALTFIADLNGSKWIKGNGPGEIDMRQRAKNLQVPLYEATKKARGES